MIDLTCSTLHTVGTIFHLMFQSWPLTLDTDDLPKKKLPGVYRAPTAEMLAYLDFSVSTTGMLAGIQMSHASTTALCRAMKLQCELYPSR